MTLQKAVATRLSNILLQKKMTQYALSKRSNVTKQSIANIINEKYNSLRFDTLVKLANGMGMTIQEFLDDDIFKKDLQI